jgi:type III secretion system low calcium response chaperone LcrH/SycD
MSQSAEIERTAAQYLEFMVHGFMNGLITLQELEGISDQEMETIYALGYNFFTYGKYDAAKDIFVGLTAYAPYTAHYWRALGAVNQQLKDYAEAISAYDMAVANDENDVVSYVYRGESHILSGNIEIGLQDLDTVIRIGGHYPEHGAWVTRAHLLLRLHRTAAPSSDPFSPNGPSFF